MNKMTKPRITVLVVGLVIIGLAIWVSYFASHVKEVISPIKDYDFSLTESKLESSILKVIKADTSLTYKVTRIVSDKDGRKYYLDISYKHNVDNCLYHVYIETKKSLFSPSIQSSLHLTGAFNVANETGGYKIEDIDVQNLVRIFEKMLITKIDET